MEASGCGRVAYGMAIAIAAVTIAAITTVAADEPQVAFADGQHGHLSQWGSYGINADGHFVHPQFITSDADGNVYITDLGNKRIQKFDSQGMYLASWGSSGHDNGQFNYPSGVTVHDDHVYVADRILNRIQKFDLDGEYVSQWGVKGNADGQFKMPNGMATGPDGHIYVVDTGNYRVQKFAPDGQFVLSFGGSGTGDGQFVIPYGIDIAEDGSVYISDRGHERIVHYAANGTYLESFKFASPGSFKFVPEGISLAANDTMVYITNAHSQNVMYLNLSSGSESLDIFERMGPLEKNVIFPIDVLVGVDGQLYVVDMLDHLVHIFKTPHYVQPPPPPPAPPVDHVPARTSGNGTGSASDDSQERSPLRPFAIYDVTPPTIVAPPNIVIEATGARTPVDLGTPDVYDENGILDVLTNAPEGFPVGVSKVTWIVFDHTKNTSEAYQYVTVLACGLPHTMYNVMMGTSSDEVIDGTPAADLIFGQAGRDVIDGGEGNDCIFGEDGDDVIMGDLGSDFLSGGPGNDILRGGANADILYGGTGADVLDGGDDSTDLCQPTDELDLVVDCKDG